MTTSLGSVCTTLEQGLVQHVSWWCMYAIGVRTRRPRLLVVYERYWGKDRIPRFLVVYLRYWGTD